MGGVGEGEMAEYGTSGGGIRGGEEMGAVGEGEMAE